MRNTVGFETLLGQDYSWRAWSKLLLSTRLFHKKEKDKKRGRESTIRGIMDGWMFGDIKFDIYPRSDVFHPRSGERDSRHAQLSCFEDFSSTAYIDARCAFNEPYRYAWRSEMTLASALECPHVARAFLVSKMKRASCWNSVAKERPIDRSSLRSAA